MRSQVGLGMHATIPFLLSLSLSLAGCHLIFAFETAGTDAAVDTIDSTNSSDAAVDRSPDAVAGDLAQSDCCHADTKQDAGSGVLTHTWAMGLGGASHEQSYDVAVGPGGNIYITGSMSGSVDFGGGTISSAGMTDIFLASFTHAGIHRWSKGFGGTQEDVGYGVTVDPSGNVTITGKMHAPVDFGGGALTSAGSSDIFLASFTQTGVHRWSKGFGSAGGEYAHDVSADGRGNVTATGWFFDAVDFGGGAIFSAGQSDIFLASFTQTGVHRWSKGFGGMDHDYGAGVVADSSGTVWATGYFTETVDFGGGSLSTTGNDDIFLVSFTQAGVHRWSKGLGGYSMDKGTAVTLDAGGNAYVTGYIMGTVDFGGGPVTGGGLGSADIFLASFTPAGAHRWSKGFGSASPDEGRGLAASGGHIYLSGTFRDTIDFGGGALTSAGSSDIFLAGFTQTGVYSWSEGFGDTSFDDGHGLAADPAGNLYATGTFSGQVDFGGGVLTSAGSGDGYLIKLSP
jgi:hypothetical protein